MFDLTIEWIKDRLWLAIGNPIGKALFFGIEPLAKKIWLLFEVK